MSRGIGIIDPTIGASEYGANFAQWDWKPFSDAMSAAKTTYGMVQGNKEEKRKQEEMEMEKLLFPSKQKKAELELKGLEADIKKTDAMTDYYLGQADADGLVGSSYGSSALLERIAASNPENTQLLAEIAERKKRIKEKGQKATTPFTLGNWDSGL
jgi:hypothetical protein